MAEPIDRVLELDSNNVDSTAGGALAKLFRVFMHNSGFVPALDFLVNRYLTKERQRRHLDGGSETVKVTTRAVLTKNIYSKDMTIKVFLDILSKVIGADKIEMSIKVHHKQMTKPVIATITINCDSTGDDELLDDNENPVPELPLVKKEEDKADGK